MKNKNHLETEFLDIIFQGRNKAYGAYYIRKTYAQRVKKSLLSIVLLVGVGLVLVSFKSEPEDVSENIISCPFEVHDLIEIDLPKDAGRHLAGVIPKTEPIIKTSQPTEIEEMEDVVKIEKPEEPIIINQEPLIGDVNGQADYTGPIGNDGTETGIMPPGDGETGIKMPDPEPEPTPEPVGFVEIMPAFPGGEEALLKFLGDNIDYPTMAVKTYTEGKVFLEFVVDEEGNISQVAIIKGLGHGCDREAMRVIRRMPKWSPGMQNGRAVPVRYKLPITFKLN